MQKYVCSWFAILEFLYFHQECGWKFNFRWPSWVPHCIKSQNYIPQVSTSSEAGPGTRIIYGFIIHICLRWNIYMRMDVSLVRFIRVAGGTFRPWNYPDKPPPASSLIFKWSRCSSSLPLIGRRAGPWLGEQGPDWASRALIGRYAEGGPA